MPQVELEQKLSSETKAMLETVRKFGKEVMRPIGEELDKMADPADVIAKDSKLWEVHKKYRELGLHKMMLPKSMGGMQGELDPIAGSLISQEMGYADSGLAISLGVSGMPFIMAMMTPNPETQKLVKEFIEDDECKMIGCWAITEPDHGSDWILSTQPDFDDPGTTPSLTAKLKGDSYVLNNRKSAWVSNGTIATHAVLHVSLDASKGMQGTGIALCPLDLPGISKAPPLDKIGQRALNQGEIIFEDVHLPKEFMFIANPELATGIAKTILIMANTSMSLTFSGLAKACFDEAFAYAKERIQGGVPIIEHQNIKLKIFDMFKKVEAASAFSRKVAEYNNARGPAGSIAHAVAAKILSTDTAFQVASDAITVLGGNGLAREYPVEKMFRDARASMIEDGVNETLAIGAVSDL